MATQENKDDETRGQKNAGTSGAAEARGRGDTGKSATKKRKDKKKHDWGAQKLGNEGANLRPSASFVKASPPTRMIAAGVIAGLLPLTHAHTFVVVMMVGACLALWLNWRLWAA